MNNVFAHPRDFAATVLQLRPHPEADEHRPLDLLDLPLVRTLQADGPTTPRSAMHRPFAVIDPELLMRRREQAARLERLRQVAVDIDAANVAEQLSRSRKSVHTAIAAARESGEQHGRGLARGVSQRHLRRRARRRDPRRGHHALGAHRQLRMRYAVLLVLVAIACALMLSCIATVTAAQNVLARPAHTQVIS